MKSSEIQLAYSIPKNISIQVLVSDLNIPWLCNEVFFLGKGSTYHIIVCSCSLGWSQQESGFLACEFRIQQGLGVLTKLLI